jgi:hypothetical protein
MLWNHDQMNVVGHEAITEDTHLCPQGVISEEIQVHLPIGIAKEHRLLYRVA